MDSFDASDGVVVVGAGLGGWSTAKALRDFGYAGRIRVLGAELHLPYDRPELSKTYLLGPGAKSPRLYATANDLRDLRIEVLLGQSARQLFAERGELRIADGTVRYETLVIATGSRARELPGLDGLQGIFTLRSLDDAERLRNALSESSRVAVLGFGLIGSEIAAACNQLGKAVTVVEASEQTFPQLGRELGERILELHEMNGVRFRLGRRLLNVVGDKKVSAIVLDDGEVIGTDIVIVAVGAIPVCEWVSGSELLVANGIRCDERLRAYRNIYAVGDVAEWPNPLYDRRMRVEHWTTTVEQARYVAKMIARPVEDRFSGVPYFWSDQFGRRFQALGLTGGESDAGPWTFEGEGGSAITLFVEGERLVGVAGIDSPRVLMQLRRVLQERGSHDSAMSVLARESGLRRSERFAEG